VILGDARRATRDEPGWDGVAPGVEALPFEVVVAWAGER
jgi:hypothetical protein